MYIPADIYGCVGSSLGPVFQELSKTKRYYDYLGSNEGPSAPIGKKAVIGISVGVAVAGLLFFSPVISACTVDLVRDIKQKRRHKRLEEEEKRKAVQPLLVAAETSGESNGNDPISNSKDDSETTEPTESQSIEKPSTALLSSKNSFQSSQRTSYEYEPLPPYEIVQARDITENV